MSNKTLLLALAGVLGLWYLARKRAAAASSSSSYAYAGDASSPVVNGGTLWNPVAALPALVPYSNKQALLGYAPALGLSAAAALTPASGLGVQMETGVYLAPLPSVANQ